MMGMMMSCHYEYFCGFRVVGNDLKEVKRTAEKKNEKL